ncbi:MAG: fis [Fibrobacteria bacterium]|jgi:two-component system response regulator HydG|nr:fis [Fibrobacteria bacterium]
MMNQSLVIVDDDQDVLDSLTRALEDLECDLRSFNNPIEALEGICAAPPQVVVTDLRMPGMGGLALQQSLKDLNPDIQVILISGHGSVDEAVSAMKKGAYDFISKPFRTEEILAVVQRAFEKTALLRENFLLREKLRASRVPNFEVGKSRIIRELLEEAVRAAASEATILILGESGSGKQILANYIVANSPRAPYPFIEVNCAAIPDNLIEAELFGYKKGAFTGAYQDKKGKFQEAHKGTIFLDEIGEVPLSVQSKLLRVLQEGEVSPVGGATQKVDVRILAATNKNLRKMVADGLFREDLFYRLNVIPLQIPPLRQHPEDLPAFISHFLAKYSAKNRRENLSVSPEAMLLMERYLWPGNVRELENAMERAVILCQGDQITPKNLPPELSGDLSETQEFLFRSGSTLEEMELLIIQNALRRNHGDRGKTAHELGIGVRTLYRKVMQISSRDPEAIA